MAISSTSYIAYLYLVFLFLSPDKTRSDLVVHFLWITKGSRKLQYSNIIGKTNNSIQQSNSEYSI